jgi:hypothetical protein
MGIKIPDYLTRYYVGGEDPFISLNDLPLEQANAIKKKHCERNNIGDFYAEDDYLIHRQEIEKWILNELLLKGGNPTYTVPIYMCLGESPNSEFDIRKDIQKNALEIRIPLKYLDLNAITFTYPDSMYRFDVDINGKLIGGGRTNTPEVFLYNELEEGLRKYKISGKIRMEEHYIEAQVWNREMLYKFYEHYL